MTLRIRKRIFISGGPVDRWHWYVEQSQVDQQLSTMVIPVIKQERPENGRARCRKQFSAPGHESPRRSRAFIAQSRQVRLRLLGTGRECGQEFLVTADRRRRTGRGGEVERIAGHEFGQLARQRRYVQGQLP